MRITEIETPSNSNDEIQQLQLRARALTSSAQKQKAAKSVETAQEKLGKALKRQTRLNQQKPAPGEQDVWP